MLERTQLPEQTQLQAQTQIVEKASPTSPLTRPKDSGSHTPEFLLRRKRMLVLPLMVLPSFFILFYSMGGGRGAAENGTKPAQTGFNASLPAARFGRKDESRDKLHVYQQADADSVKRGVWQRQDPNRAVLSSANVSGQQPAQGLSQSSLSGQAVSKPDSPSVQALRPLPSVDPRADELLKKLDALKRSMQQPLPLPAASPPAHVDAAMTPTPEINRLQRLMLSIRSMNGDTTETDPQLKRLDGMLDKILAIQHPAGQDGHNKAGAALGMPDSLASMAIPAIVQADQTLVTGTTIALRLTEECLINGVTIPKDQLIYGMVSINNDRMLVNINAIRRDQSIYATALQVYDMDGLPGIHIPGVLTRDVAKESAVEGINDVGLTSYDPTIGAQAASAGIQAARTLLSRKVKLIRVSVKSGYQVLLRNNRSSGNAGWLRTAVAARPLGLWGVAGQPDSSLSGHQVAVPSGFAPFLHQSTREGRLQLVLEGIYLRDRLMWFRFRMVNHSSIDFAPDYSRWFIRDRHVLARTAIQEVPVVPVVAGLPAVVPGGATRTFFIGFQPFALRADKELVWQVGERDGARLLVMPVEAKEILKARSHE